MPKSKTDLMLEALVWMTQAMQKQWEVLDKISQKLEEKPLPPQINQDSYIDKMENTIKAMPKWVVWYKILLWIKDDTWYISYDPQAYQHMTFNTKEEMFEFVQTNKIQDYKYNTLRS